MTEMETQQNGAVVEPLSVSDKFIGILSEPTATYENVHQTGPRTTDWLIPLLALVVIILATTLIRFSDPAFLDSIRQKAAEQMQERVEKGELSQEQADETLDQMEKFSGIQKFAAAGGVILGVPFVFFLIALIYWLIIRFLLKGGITYLMVLAVSGLTAYIGVIDQLVSVILGYVTGNFMATFSPGLFMTPDMASTSYKLANALNPITIWGYVVLSIGFHVTAGISKAKAYGVVFGLWILWTLLMSFANLPIGTM